MSSINTIARSIWFRTSEVSISVTVDSNERLPEICAELGKIADVKLEGKKALVCLVGEDIRGHAGISGRVFGAIRHINVRMISQGASEINMSFMIEESDVEEAIRSLHAEFFAEPDATVFEMLRLGWRRGLRRRGASVGRNGYTTKFASGGRRNWRGRTEKRRTRFAIHSQRGCDVVEHLGAERSDCVLDAGRDLGEDLAGDEAVAFEAAKGFGEGLLTDACNVLHDAGRSAWGGAVFGDDAHGPERPLVRDAGDHLAG